MDNIEESAVTESINPESREKTLTQAEVNDIVKREKLRAAEQARKELEAKHRGELERISSNSNSSSPGIDESEIEKRVYERFLDELQQHSDQAQKQAEENRLKAVAEKFYLKMGKGSQLFDDFNEITADFEPDKFPNAVLLAAEMEHTPEIIYELANNPSKLQEIDALAQKSPKLAMKQMERLSESIRKNLDAKATNVSAPPPLSRLKPSQAGADNGKMTLKDLKNAPWLRG